MGAGLSYCKNKELQKCKQALLKKMGAETLSAVIPSHKESKKICEMISFNGNFSIRLNLVGSYGPRSDKNE